MRRSLKKYSAFESNCVAGIKILTNGFGPELNSAPNPFFGFSSTLSIVLPDGGYTRKDLRGRQYKDEAQASAELRQAAPIMGFHYPCGYPDLQINETMSSWASEDFSSHNLGVNDPKGGPGWTSGSYWGRLLNQNFVRMNMTTTIAWALIWSVLPGLGCEGDGLTLANSPWSGHYEVDAAIWTTAHWTQVRHVAFGSTCEE